MSDRPRRPIYVYGLYVAAAMLALAFIDFVKRDTSGLKFDLSLTLFFTAAGFLFYFIARNNKHKSGSPIPLWLRQCCFAAIAFLIGAYNVFAGADGFSCFLFFLASGFLAANAGYYYVKDRSRTS